MEFKIFFIIFKGIALKSITKITMMYILDIKTYITISITEKP